MAKAQFRMSHALKRAIETSGQSQTALGHPIGLTQSDLSRYMHGRLFGPRVRTKIEMLGLSLGLDLTQCCRGPR